MAAGKNIHQSLPGCHARGWLRFKTNTGDPLVCAASMLHISDANYVLATVASDKPNPVGETLANDGLLEKTASQTKEATTKAVMDSYDFVISTLQNMTPEQLKETTKFACKHDVYKKRIIR